MKNETDSYTTDKHILNMCLHHVYSYRKKKINKKRIEVVFMPHVWQVCSVVVKVFFSLHCLQRQLKITARVRKLRIIKMKTKMK